MNESPEISGLQLMEPMRTDATNIPLKIAGSDEQVKDSKSKLFAKLTSNSTQQLIVTKPQANSLKPNDTQSIPKSPSTNNTSNSLTKQTDLNQAGQEKEMSDPSSDQKGANANQEDPETVVFTGSKSRWYTNEEVASILTNFNSHPEWQTHELKFRPKSGAVLLYSREKVRYRQDGYCWKKRKNGRTTREDHMKLKVQGIECIYGCYVHSALLPTFHRRCYWLLQNPDIVLVHYLNQPPDDQNKMVITFDSSLLEIDTRRTWTNEEIIEEIGSVFGGISQIKHTLNINYSSSTIVLQQDQQKQMLQDQSNNATSDLLSGTFRQSITGLSNSTANNMTILSDQEKSQEVAIDDEKNNSNSSMMSDESTAISQDDADVLSGAKNYSNNINGNHVKVREFICDANHSEYDPKTKLVDWKMGQNGHISKKDRVLDENHIDTINNSVDNAHNRIENQQQLIKMENQYNYNVQRGSMPCGDHDNVQTSNVNNQTGMGQVDDHSTEKLESCSPVTQIYNKIVDDIESYALPLGENQFNPASSLGTVQHDNSLLMNMPIDRQHDSQHHRHEGEHSLPLEHHQHLQAQQYDAQQQADQQLNLDCGKTANRSSHYAINSSHENKSSMSNDQTPCSMDLTPCDIFGDAPLTAEDEVQQNTINEDENSIMIDNTGSTLMMSDDFNCLRSDHPLEGHQITEDIGTSVVDTGLENLITEGSSKDRPSGLLIESKFPELFNYKPSGLSQRQQSDAKSSTSDTDTMNRLSPICLMAPRCNSTDNGMLGGGNQNMFLSNVDSVFMRNVSQGGGSYLRLDDPTSSGVNCITTRSSDCSPLISARTTGLTQCQVGELTQVPVSTTSSASSSSQQPSRNDQKESNPGFSSNLLPKALSLDGSDLPSVNHRRMSTGIPSQHNNHNYGQFNHHSRQQLQNQSKQHLLMPSSANYFHSQSPSDPEQSAMRGSSQFVQEQRPSAPSLSLSVSPTNIPMKNSSEILVNSGLVDLNSESTQQQPQQQSNTRPYSRFLSFQSQPDANQQFSKQNGQISDIVPIIDYVPNYSSTSGGTKVLIIGNWISLVNNGQRKEMQQKRKSIFHSTSNDTDELSGFYALFDNLLVSATLIQDNVLKCYAPSHEPGFITLKVLYMNGIVSDQVFFEIRPSCAHITDSYHHKLDQIRTDTGNNSHSNSASKIETNQDINSITSHQSLGFDPPNNNCSNDTHMKNQANPADVNDGSSHNRNSQKLMSSRSFTGETNPKVLALAENIISAMHKKNSVLHRMPDNISRLTNSLDIDFSVGMYPRRNKSCTSRGLQYMNGSRSLSRESEPPLMGSYYTTNLDGLIDSDPYWHQSSYEPTIADFRRQQQQQQQQQKNLQPLSVITDFNQAFGLPTTIDFSGNYVLGRKRHSSSSAGYLSTSPCQQRASHCAPRPSFVGSINQWSSGVASNNSSQAQTADPQNNNCTETSSSGLGSVVSSLSPSTSSLHSPSSALAVSGVSGPLAAAVAAAGATTASNTTTAIPSATSQTLDSNRKQSSEQTNEAGELSPTFSCGRQSSGTPTSADFCEYFQASAKTEEIFASLTLNDVEQQELYEAAKVIQKAYRTYRGRKRQASELLISTAELSLPTNSNSSAKQSADDCLNSNNLMCVDNDYDIGGCNSQYVRVGCRTINGPIHDQSRYHLHHHHHHHHHFEQVALQGPKVVKCYHDREMQAATIIQACYRRYRQYANFKRQQESSRRTSFGDHCRHYQQQQQQQHQHQQQQQNSVSSEQQQYGFSSNGSGSDVTSYWPQSAQVVIETLPVIIDKAASSHVDRKRFKTASLINDTTTTNGNRTAVVADQSSIESSSTNASNTSA